MYLFGLLEPQGDLWSLQLCQTVVVKLNLKVLTDPNVFFFISFFLWVLMKVNISTRRTIYNHQSHIYTIILEGRFPCKNKRL